MRRLTMLGLGYRGVEILLMGKLKTIKKRFWVILIIKSPKV